MTAQQTEPFIEDNHARRLGVILRGAVQGVGFRPFIYRLAMELQLKGWVKNSSQGVALEVEGKAEALNTFLKSIEKEKPSHSFILSFESSFQEPAGYTDFTILTNQEAEKSSALVLPDMATCSICLE